MRTSVDRRWWTNKSSESGCNGWSLAVTVVKVVLREFVAMRLGQWTLVLFLRASSAVVLLHPVEKEQVVSSSSPIILPASTNACQCLIQRQNARSNPNRTDMQLSVRLILENADPWLPWGRPWHANRGLLLVWGY
jgi:hypothetical protein